MKMMAIYFGDFPAYLFSKTGAKTEQRIEIEITRKEKLKVSLDLNLQLGNKKKKKNELKFCEFQLTKMSSSLSFVLFSQVKQSKTNKKTTKVTVTK